MSTASAFFIPGKTDQSKDTMRTPRQPSTGRYSIVAAIVLLLGACAEEGGQPAAEPAVRPVKLLTVEASTADKPGRYPAVIDAAQSSALSFQVGGLIRKLPVKEAQAVEAGAVIAELEQRDYRNQLTTAKARFENLEQDFQRMAQLLKQRVVSKSEFEKLKSQRDIARAQLDSAQKSLSDTVLKAPFTGIVARVAVKAQQTVGAGEPVATIISPLDKLEATIDLPASVVATAPTHPNRSALVLLDAAPHLRIPAEYKAAVLEADAVSQTYAVTFTFAPPPDLAILPGMTATVVLTLSGGEAAADHSAVAVPLAAIISDGEQQYLWVVDTERMQVARRAVTIRDGIGETVVVTAGLRPGETIVGAGAAYLAEGMPVRRWAP